MNARTVAGPVRIRGRGLFSRAAVELRARPAGPGTGLVFTGPGRGSPELRAQVGQARVGRHCTVLGQGRSRVRAVEHLLAACLGLGITDLRLDCPDREPPFGDGSSGHFVRALCRAGFRESAGGPAPLVIRSTIMVRAGGGFLLARPADRLRVTCITEFPWSGPERVDWAYGPDKFIRELAQARTVAYTTESENRLRRTLGLRFRLRGCAGYLLPARPRMAGETCRHKLLDLLGDLALLGRPPVMELLAFRPSHRLNLELVRHLAGPGPKNRNLRGEAAV